MLHSLWLPALVSFIQIILLLPIFDMDVFLGHADPYMLSVCSLSCPDTPSVDLAGLELTEIHLPLPPGAEIKGVAQDIFI